MGRRKRENGKLNFPIITLAFTQTGEPDHGILDENHAFKRDDSSENADYREQNAFNAGAR